MSLLGLLLGTAALPAAALPNRTLVPVEDDGPGRFDGWNASSTCAVSYYAPCGPYVWVFSPEQAGDTFGVVFDACGPNAQLSGVWTLDYETMPAGWGYTGIISVHAVDANDAPSGPALAAAPFLADGGWNFYLLSAAVPSRFVVTARYDGAVGGSGAGITLDNPSCLVHSEPHSYYFGTPDAPLSPGWPFELSAGQFVELFYRAEMTTPTAIQTSTWGGVKNLYR